MQELNEEITYIKDSIRMPRKIREDLTQCIELLNEKDKQNTEKINNVMLVLEEINTMKIVPPMLRTEVWNIIGKIESLEKTTKV